MWFVLFCFYVVYFVLFLCGLFCFVFMWFVLFCFYVVCFFCFNDDCFVFFMWFCFFQ